MVRGREPLLLPSRWAGVTQRAHGEHTELALPDASLLGEVVRTLLDRGYELISAQTRHRSLESVVLEYADATWNYRHVDPYAPGEAPGHTRRAG